MPGAYPDPKSPVCESPRDSQVQCAGYIRALLTRLQLPSLMDLSGHICFLTKDGNYECAVDNTSNVSYSLKS